ncbi:MAG: endonuclease III domain-containing protein [Desulfovibrionaceae bacterium]
MRRGPELLDIHQRMLDRLGPSGWWPGDSPFEVALGAVLTQNASWANVAKAIANVRKAGLLHPMKLAALPEHELAELIRPSGYYRIKAKRLRHLLAFLESEDAADLQLGQLRRQDPHDLRRRLLAVNGVGPETCDSILLYALDMPFFVVDAYTFRMLNRHGLVPEDAGYQEMQDLFMDALDPDPMLFNEFHALIVRTAAAWCRKKAPLCHECPLGELLP